MLCDVDMGDQASRWRGVLHLDAPSGAGGTPSCRTWRPESRYVRTQWLMEYLRGRSDVGEAARMRAELQRTAGNAGQEGGSRRPIRASPRPAALGIPDRAQGLGDSQ